MRIISDFTDYYDCIQRVAQDRTLVYIRNRSEQNIDKYNRYGHVELMYSLIKIEFCGKVYLCYKMRHGEHVAFCYNMADIDKFVTDNCSEKIAKSVYFEPKSIWSGSGRAYFVDKYYKHSVENYPTSVCFEAPIIITDYYNGIKTKNACLKDYAFYRIFNPVMAFQELSMYLGSMAVPMKPEPRIDDKTKAELHGFNQFSFRKDKSR